MIGAHGSAPAARHPTRNGMPGWDFVTGFGSYDLYADIQRTRCWAPAAPAAATGAHGVQQGMLVSVVGSSYPHAK